MSYALPPYPSCRAENSVPTELYMLDHHEWVMVQEVALRFAQNLITEDLCIILRAMAQVEVLGAYGDELTICECP